MQTAVQPTIIAMPSNNGLNPNKVIFGIVAATGLVIVGKMAYDKLAKNSAEKDMDTPAGELALQLKTVFESFPVDDNEYRRVASQITPALKDEVYKLYRKVTLRNLSDDIATKIKAGAQATAAKQAAINSTTGTLITIDASDRIKFQVGPGSLIRFEPGSTASIPLYYKPEDIASSDKVIYNLQPSAIQFLVKAVKEVPIEGMKVTEGWTKYFKPFTLTRKVYAAVQIQLKNKNGGYINLWADARLFRTGKGTNYLKGLGCTCMKQTVNLAG